VTLRRTYVDTRFGQAHLRIATPAVATAAPVLCVPPQPLSGRPLEPLIAALGRSRRAIAVDLPGFGLSDGPATAPTLDDYLGWLLDVAAALQLSSFAALGWLTGGRFVVPLAALHPRLVSRVVLVGAPVPTPEQRATQAPPAVPAPQRDGSHLQSEWARWMAWWPEGTPLPEPSDQFADTLLGLGRPERSWMVDVTRHVLHETWLPQVAQPVQVINPAGLMHDATARVAPHLRNGHVVDTALAMFPLMSAAHAHEAAELVTTFLDGGADATGRS
jgi:pimeloyl-ACP methyl ester carboxylesterase